MLKAEYLPSGSRCTKHSIVSYTRQIVCARRFRRTQAVGRILPGQIAEIKHATEPRILGSREIDATMNLVTRGFELQAHNTGIAECRLVEVVQAIYNAHDLEIH